MHKLKKTLVLTVVIIQILLLLAGCGKNSVIGIYSRDFGRNVSATIELKKDNTYQADMLVLNLPSKGTYEINGDVITFTFENPFKLFSSSDTADTRTGTISGGTLTFEGVEYIK